MVYVSGDDGDTHDDTEPTWPGTVAGTVVDNDITWTCSGEGVPKVIRQAIMLQVTDYFRMREPYLLGTIYRPLKTVQSLLWPYRIFGGAI